LREVGAVARVEADDDQAVVDVAADAHAGQRAGAEGVGSAARPPEDRVTAKVGADAQNHPLQVAANLQDLQSGGRELAGSVAASGELGQRRADVGAPVGTCAFGVDAVRAAADRPQAGNGAADLHRAEDKAAGADARQAQVAEGVLIDAEAAQAVAFEAGAGPSRLAPADISARLRLPMVVKVAAPLRLAIGATRLPRGFAAVIPESMTRPSPPLPANSTRLLASVSLRVRW